MIAHRGAAHDAPEHTVHAYAAAVEQGADGLELDLQLTADGVLVACHDDTLERIAGVPDRVAEVAHERLLDLDVGAWFNRAFPDRADERFVGARILSLAEVLARFPYQRLLLELKDPGQHGGRLERALVDTLGAAGELAPADPRCLVIAFDGDSLGRVHALSPDLPVGLLWIRAEASIVAAEVSDWIRVSAPNVYPLLVHPDHVAAAHARGLEVYAWTVDEPDEITAVAATGADGIITNRPALARRVLAGVP